MASVDIELKGIDNASKMISGVGDAINEMAIGALRHLGELAIDGFGKVTEAIGSFVKDAMEAEKLTARLDAVIKSSGKDMGFTTDIVNKLADQFKDLAGGSDEAVKAIEEMALRMGTVTADQMPGFIQTTLDLAAATGTDATTAARTLAQAYDDPASAMARFGKMGIRFDADLQKQIKALVKAGKTGEAYNLMMGRLAESTAGAAAGQADTLSGQIGIMQEHLLDAGKAIGEALLPTLKELFENVIKPGLAIVEDFALKGADAIGRFIGLLKEGIDPITAFSIVMNNVFGTEVGKQVEALLIPFQTLIEYIKTQFPLFQAAILSAWANIQAAAAQFGPAIQSNVLGILQELKIWWDKNGPLVVAIVTATFNTIVNIAGPTMVLLTGIIKGALELINGDWEQSHITMTTSFETFMAAIVALTGTDLETVRASWQWVFEAIFIIVQTIINNILIFVGEWFIGFIAVWQSNWEMAGTIVSTVGNSIVGSINSWIARARAAIQPLFDMIESARKAVEDFTNMSIPSPASQAESAIAGGNMPHAGGGPTLPGQGYIVGEHGPEWFSPSVPGNISNIWNVNISSAQSTGSLSADLTLARIMAGA